MRNARRCGPQHEHVAILQFNYIPWNGYFGMIAAVDEFISYDETQYTRRDWVSRNQIMRPQGTVAIFQARARISRLFER